MTPKQELFAQAYLETSNASEAYKRAYNTQANANTINRKASQLLKHPEVIKLLADLQAIHRQRHKLTIDDFMAITTRAYLSDFADHFAFYGYTKL